MEVIIGYILPALVLFIAQTALCLGCKNKYIRLIPTVIALGITVYHTAILIANLDDMWAPALGIAYMALTVLPPLAGVGFGWMIYVVKLMIQEAKALHQDA